MTTWVIMTVREREALTRRSLDALMERTPADVGFMVVDCGSLGSAPDYPYAMLRHGRIHKLICNAADTVPQWQKSYAIRQAVDVLSSESYQYFAWVDNDVQVMTGWLQAAKKVLTEMPEVDVCSVHNDVLQEKLHPTVETRNLGSLSVRLKKTANGALWVVRGVFFKKWGLPPVGKGITQDGTEDWHYSGVMRRHGKMIAVVDGFSDHIGQNCSLRERESRIAKGEKVEGATPL
ncbi:hypothetical protein LCGC14_1250660 [marine sediment metagenome]|uniref:Glycosyltransferase 2-like domain-containing protein n=1 Tax=marine sediment metagenome TaxID=412755 RepID=A0A0F9NKB2_9ZZZZ